MSLGHGAKIVTNGLVFAYDMGPNPGVNKSWKGAPTTNIFSAGRDTDNSASLFTYYFGTGASGTIGSEYLGKGITAKTATITTSTNSYTNFQVYMGNVSLTGGSTYTVSAMVWTNVPFTCRIGAIQNGSPFTTYVPLNQVSLSYGWNFIFSVGTYATTVTDARFQLDFGKAPVGTTIKVIKPQIEQSNYATPYVNGTRSNTESLLDWTGNNTITASSLTYNSDGTFSFNGSSNYVSSSSVSLGSDPIVTVNQWIRRTANFSNGGYWGLGGGSVNNGINGYTSVTNKIGWDLWGQTTFHTGQDYPLNQWVNVCWVKTATTFTTSTLKIYINGVEFPLTTTVRNNSSTVNLRDSIAIGRLADNTNSYYAPGNIGGTQVYNRALTADEVKTNYNAFKPIFDGPMYRDLTFITTAGTIEYTNNGTKSVTFYKSGGTNTSWNTGAFCPLPFTAPCTIEYTKNAASSDNGLSYAMIGWNPSPNNSASYTDLDYAAYPFQTSALRIYHNGSNQGDFGSGWDPNKRLYVVYDTDGYIRHYNGDTLIASFNYGTGNTVYIDTALYKIDSTYGGFTNIKACNKSWNGTSYV